MRTDQPFNLSTEFNDLLDLLEKSNESVFITGRAGTGKSTLLQLFRNTTRKRTVVLAPTGVAALNVKGQTIHSFFRLPPRLIQTRDIVKLKNNYVIKKVEVIVIDEVSMVRVDMIDVIDRSLRLNRNSDIPFGGVQMVFIGDLFQLPPVLASDGEKKYLHDNYDSPYFFSAHILKLFHMSFFELNKVYRQEERRFINLLDNIRTGHFDQDDLDDINQRVLDTESNYVKAITLTSTNAKAHSINQDEMTKISGKTFTYHGKVDGDFNQRLFPTKFNLSLKVGCQVMMVKNDLDKRFVNGSIGEIVSLTHDKIIVNILDNEDPPIAIEPVSWEVVKYRFNPDNDQIEHYIAGSFIQHPLKLAWAITIHKSQGKTFDSVIVDLGRGAFEHGQVYVAMSRCRTLGGMWLAGPLRARDVMVDQRIISYYDTRINYL